MKIKLKRIGQLGPFFFKFLVTFRGSGLYVINPVISQYLKGVVITQ